MRNIHLLCIVILYLILMLCACSAHTAETAAPTETVSETVSEATIAVREPESMTVGSKYALKVDNDILRIAFRDGWNSSSDGSDTLTVEIPGKYMAEYSDSDIRAGDIDSIQSRMTEEFDVGIQDTGKIEINGFECYAGYKAADDDVQYIYMFQDVGLHNYVLIKISNMADGSIEEALSEFAVY